VNKLQEHPEAVKIKARAVACAAERMSSKLLVVKAKNGRKAREILAKKSRAAVVSSNQVMGRLKRMLESSGNSKLASTASDLAKSVASLVQPLMLQKMVRGASGEWEVSKGLDGLTIPLRDSTALVLGRYDKGWALLRAKPGVTVFNTGIGDEESSMSRTQATLHLLPDLSVRVTAGGTNSICVDNTHSIGSASGARAHASDAPPIVQLRKPKKKELEDADAAASIIFTARMFEGAVLELDGFKRSNPAKYPEGPQYAYQVFAVPAPSR